MIPIKDENPTRSFPLVNYLLITANVLAYVWQSLLMQQLGPNAVIAGYGLVATRLATDPAGESFTIFTSMFMHSGFWTHLAPNMLFLHIFGDNVEDALGHVRYLFFYLAAGVAAAATQIVFSGIDSPAPMVGASGAIFGMLGAYLVLYPRAPILMLNFSIPILWLVYGLFMSFPAWMVIGYYFVIANVLPAFLGASKSSNVAFFAHIGGFLFGLLAIRAVVRDRPRESSSWAGFHPPERPRRPSPASQRSRYEAWRDH